MTLQQIYHALLQRYDINTQGETVTEFTDKGTVHSYIEFYQDLLHRYNRPSILEIGVMTGASLLMWDLWLDAEKIVGVDLRQGWNKPAAWHSEIESSDNIAVLFGVDSTLPLDLEQQFDIIIDDGSHAPQDQMLTFDRCFPLLAPGGVYVIEDIIDAQAMWQVRDHVERHLSWRQLMSEDQVQVGEYHGHKLGRGDDQCLWIQLL